MRLPCRVTRGWRAIFTARLRLAAREHRRLGRFAHDDLRRGHLFIEHARHALQRSARAEPGDEIIETFALEVVDDLARRRLRVVVGVCFVLELAREEPAVLAAETVRLSIHSRRWL